MLRCTNAESLGCVCNKDATIRFRRPGGSNMKRWRTVCAECFAIIMKRDAGRGKFISEQIKQAA